MPTKQKTLRNQKVDVSVIIVNYNTCDLTLACINSVNEKTQNVSFEIIVVDNLSKDRSVEQIKYKFPEVILIESNHNLGFGKANNLGVKHASGNYVFLLNSDTILLNNAVKILFDFMDDALNFAVGACGGNLYCIDNQPNYSYSLHYPSLYGVFCYRSKLNLLLRRAEYFNFSGKNKQVAIIIGADLFIRKHVFDQLGGFDPEFFMYVEDGELLFRLSKYKYKIFSVPEAKILHYQGKSSSNSSKLKMEYTGYLIFFNKHYGLITVMLYRSIELFFALIRLVLYLLLFNKLKVRAYLSLIKLIISNKCD